MMPRFLRGATIVLLAAAALDAAAAPCPATTVQPATSLPGATVGVNYSQTFTASNTNSLPFTFAVTSGLPAAAGLGFTGGNLTGSPTQTGNYVITVSATDSSGCTGGRTYALAIAQGTQTISFASAAPATAAVGGAPYAVSANATSGLPVTLAIDASSSAVCTLAGGNVTFQGVGTCTINANQAGDANYAAAPQAQQSFAVARGAQTITFTSTAPTGATFGGPTYAVAATATSGLPVTFAIDASASAVCSIAGGTVSFIGTGTCVVNANQAGDATYDPAPQVQQSFAVARAAQTITFTSTAPTGATFGGPTYAVAATATSGLPVTFTIDASASAVCSIAGSTVNFIGAGTCVVNANQAGDASYDAAPQAQQSFTVARAAQIIMFTTAPTGVTFGGPTYAVAATATSGLPVTFTIDASASAVCSIAGNTVSFIGTGTCVINANQAGDANYDPAPQEQQSFTVSKADQTIAFTSTAPTSVVVGVTTYAVTATASSGLPVTFAIDATSAAVCSLAGNTVSFQAAGTCMINANQAGDANWNAAPQVQQSVAAGSCVSLALGQVMHFAMPADASPCVANTAGIDTEYTLIPMNFSTSASAALSLTATGIQPVTGPPSPRPADGLALAPLAADQAQPAETEPHAFESPAAFPPERGHTMADLIPTARGGVTPLVVGQLIDLNAAMGGCGVAPDIRKGRVEYVTTAQTPGQPLLFAVQEVVETTPGAADWHPPVPGGYLPQDFQAITDSFVMPPPGNTTVGQGTLGGLLKTGGMEISRAHVGTISDVDSNGGVILFFTRKMNELSLPASSGVAQGAFLPRDLFSAASCPGSNEHEMLYLMVPDPTGVVNSNVRTLSFTYGSAPVQLTHHYAHLVNASRRLYFNGAAPFEETWLDEALAWEMQELSFFSASVGLTARNNIALANLTTGPNASVRVAAFNTYQNTMFGHWRTWLYQLNASNGNLRMGPLRTSPISTGTAPNVHENAAPNHAVSHQFLRYALDRRNTGDAALINALVNTSAVGTANLQAVLAAPLTDWARDFLVAAYTDDAVTGIAPEYTHPSWNYRSVYGGLGGFPISVNPLADGTPLAFAIGPGGGSRYARFGIVTGGSGNITLTEGGVAPNAQIQMAIVRTK